MPLSDPAARRPVHRRAVHTEAWRRDDGLWDIEAHLHDAKAFDVQDFRRGRIPAGGAIHDMRVRVTIDDALVVRAIESTSDDAPFSGCAGPADEFAALVGLTLGRGWHRAVYERFGGTRGCTHLVALFDPIATTAFQALCGGPDPRGEDPLAWPGHRARKPFFIGGCRSWREDGEVVAAVFGGAAWRRAGKGSAR